MTPLEAKRVVQLARAISSQAVGSAHVIRLIRDDVEKIDPQLGGLSVTIDQLEEAEDCLRRVHSMFSMFEAGAVLEKDDLRILNLREGGEDRGCP